MESSGWGGLPRDVGSAGGNLASEEPSVVRGGIDVLAETEVPTKTDSPGFRAGVAGKGGSSVGSDHTAIEVTPPVSDRVITFDPPGSAVSPSNSTALSLSA